MNFSRVSIVCAMVFTSCLAFAEEGAYAVSGSAYDIKTGKLVYRELIGKVDESKEVHINYARPNGVIFARKTLNYETEAFQPGVVFEDARDDETVSAQFEAGTLILTHRLKGDSQTKTLYDTAKLVVDAGLDAYIQLQWSKITSGKKIEFEIADPRHKGTEKLVIKEIDASASPLAYKGAGSEWKYFRMETANKLSSLLVDPMYFAYDPNGMFLMRYQGRANIDSDKGDMWDVRIEYEYW